MAWSFINISRPMIFRNMFLLERYHRKCLALLWCYSNKLVKRNDISLGMLAVAEISLGISVIFFRLEHKLENI